MFASFTISLIEIKGKGFSFIKALKALYKDSFPLILISPERYYTISCINYVDTKNVFVKYMDKKINKHRYSCIILCMNCMTFNDKKNEKKGEDYGRDEKKKLGQAI